MKRVLLSLKSRYNLYATWAFQKILKLFIRTNPHTLVFMPRGGMGIDGYDFFNFTSDNALALLRYTVDNYGNTFRYRLACDVSQYQELHQSLKSIKEVDIDCFPYYNNKKPICFKKYLPIVKAKYIFLSETQPIYTKKKSQKVVFLNYFIPFKDDYGHEGHPLIKMDNVIDYSITTSKLSSYIISTTYNISFAKCHILGFSRNDCLLTPKENMALDEFICRAVNYNVKKVILYTPTYRDYESVRTSERGLLGFGIDNNRIGSLLKRNEAVILCKIHSTQNRAVINNELPEGIILYPSDGKFGLCELLQRADCLITDYTSTYFDYLLLDRPVIFNFYDFDEYQKTRGFSYDPLTPFLAGDVFYDENSFFESINKYFEGEDNHVKERELIRNIHHKYQDAGASERICNFLFE